jgi:Phosphoserine phosphatase RsbU, N-terminal domain/GAF domain
MSAGTGPFRAAYASALVDYLLEPSETPLRVAYELAREAVSRGFNVLELAEAHQQALMSVLLDASDAAEAQAIARAAGDFFLEGLSTFEMVQRGLAEAREAALLERRQTRLSRQLSTFLADASLALDASESLEEMLRLVAEQARELVGADCCVATVAVRGRPRAAEGASYQEDEPRWTTFIRWLDLPAIYRVVRQSGGSVRIAGEQLERLRAFCTADSARPLRGWLAASLTALDSSELGAIQLFDKQGAGFTVDDEAALVHLAQMTSAAVERARLYHERS